MPRKRWKSMTVFYTRIRWYRIKNKLLGLFGLSSPSEDLLIALHDYYSDMEKRLGEL